MSFGAFITKGPMNWQIIQQINGFADIELSGNWIAYEEAIECVVYAKIVREDMGTPVINWQKCDTASDGNWHIILRNIPAGGLYTIESCLNQDSEAIEWSKRGDMIHHIGIGDIYVIAGQSNSAGYGKDPVYDPPELGVHLYRNSGWWDLAIHPMNESTATIHEVNMEKSNPGHSPYLSFAKVLKREVGYPIGLIQAAQGGSPLSKWNADEEGTLYKSMVDSIKSQGGKIRGVLWYQGCTEAMDKMTDCYLERFSNMVSRLRKDLEDAYIPFLTIQLNRYLAPSDEISDRSWGEIREAQRQAANSISNVFVIPAIDCLLSDFIHNSSSSNMILGERLARMALSEIYGKHIDCKAPEIAIARNINNNQIMLEFDNVFLRLDALRMGVKQFPFTVEDAKGRTEIIGVDFEGTNKIRLTLSRELEGKSFVHCAYEQNPMGFIPNDIGSYLPLLAFYNVEIS